VLDDQGDGLHFRATLVETSLANDTLAEVLYARALPGRIP
jgi:hypothetical protein